MQTFDQSMLPELELERAGGTLVRRKGVCIVQLRGSYADMGLSLIHI